MDITGLSQEDIDIKELQRPGSAVLPQLSGYLKIYLETSLKKTYNIF